MRWRLMFTSVSSASLKLFLKMSEIPKAYEPQSVEEKWNQFWLAVVFSIAVLFTTGCGKSGGGDYGTDPKKIVTITKDNFDKEVLQSAQPVLVDFWADWCGPCKMVAPVIADLSVEFEGRMKIGKVDVDAETPLAKKYNISAIPTLLVFKNGKQVDQVIGLQNKEQLKSLLNKFADKESSKAATPNPDAPARQ